jgi:hypothetical protein
MITYQATVSSALSDLASTGPIRLRIQGDCMFPLLRSGAKVEVVGKRFYWPGDVVIVHSIDGRLLAHRLIGCYVKSGRLKWLTQADAAERPDCAVSTRKIIGRVYGGECSALLANISNHQRLWAAGRFLRFVTARLLYCVG